MARQIVDPAVVTAHMRAQQDVLTIGQDRLDREFGRKILNRHGKRKIYAILKEMLDDPGRKGDYALMAARPMGDGASCVFVYISDPDTRFEFKLRWC